MGHIRLGELPRTRRWEQVVGLIRCGAGTAQVANATITAANRGLAQAASDTGVIETLWLLTRLPLAARSDDFVAALRQCGLTISDTPGVMEVVASVTEAIDAKMPNCRGRTDLGEMAQMAAAETLTRTVGSRTTNLFGTTSDDVRQALGQLATAKKFSSFAKEFFARFTHKCLDYFLSKAVAHHIGKDRRFHTLTEQGEFIRALEKHCREAAVIVEDFSGGWFSKKNWESGGQITREDIKGFTSYAMTKITAELTQGAANAK